MSDVSDLPAHERTALAGAIRHHLRGKGEPATDVRDPSDLTDAELDAAIRDAGGVGEAIDRSFQEFIAATPDLEAWMAETEAEQARQREREQAIRERVSELVKAGMPWQEARPIAENPPELDPDTLALLQRAEAYLKENP